MSVNRNGEKLTVSCKESEDIKTLLHHSDPLKASKTGPAKNEKTKLAFKRLGLEFHLHTVIEVINERYVYCSLPHFNNVQ